MKVRLTIEVGDRARFVVAKYWAPVSSGADRTRTRASRAQVRRFIEAALRTAINDQAAALRGRSRATAKRLAEPKVEPETLREPAEQQMSISF
jgi:hypothetical protein